MITYRDHFVNLEMSIRKTDSEGPDQTAPMEQSDQGLHCLSGT